MKKRQQQQGFTLIELMISLTLFVIVVLAVIGSLYAVNNASRKAASMRQVLDNINFAIDLMSRTVRTGSDLVCDPGTTSRNCPMGSEPGGAIQVTDTLGEKKITEFRYNGSAKSIERNTKPSNDPNAPFPSDGWIRMTSPDVSVDTMFFYVNGADSGDTVQPSVTIFVKGAVKSVDGEVVPFSVQTFASQRTIR